MKGYWSALAVVKQRVLVADWNICSTEVEPFLNDDTSVAKQNSKCIKWYNVNILYKYFQWKVVTKSERVCDDCIGCIGITLCHFTIWMQVIKCIMNALVYNHSFMFPHFFYRQLSVFTNFQNFEFFIFSPYSSCTVYRSKMAALLLKLVFPLYCLHHIYVEESY